MTSEEAARGVACVLSMMAYAIEGGDGDVRLADALRVLAEALETEREDD